MTDRKCREVEGVTICEGDVVEFFKIGDPTGRPMRARVEIAPNNDVHLRLADAAYIKLDLFCGMKVGNALIGLRVLPTSEQ